MCDEIVGDEQDTRWRSRTETPTISVVEIALLFPLLLLLLPLLLLLRLLPLSRCCHLFNTLQFVGDGCKSFECLSDCCLAAALCVCYVSVRYGRFIDAAPVPPPHARRLRGSGCCLAATLSRCFGFISIKVNLFVSTSLIGDDMEFWVVDLVIFGGWGERTL